MTTNTQSRLVGRFCVATLLACWCRIEPALAQTSESQANRADQAIAEVVVTGTRIARPETNSVSPIVSFDSQALENSGKPALIDFLSNSPALVSSQSGGLDQGGGAGTTKNLGVASLNLRNLGSNRTLVLVNGRRHVSAVAGQDTVDINTIPVDLIERVDIVTGGASAVYGADAVTGAVNFVMKKNFEGFLTRGQIGESGRGDANSDFGAVTWGTNFEDNRGNIVFSLEFNKTGRLAKTRRNFSNPATACRLVPNPADVPDNGKTPVNIPACNIHSPGTGLTGAFDVGSTNSAGKFVPGAFDSVADFTGTGKTYNYGTVLPNPGGFGIGGDGVPWFVYTGADLQSPVRRNSANTLGHFDFSSAVKVYWEAKFNRTTSATTGYPTYDTGTTIRTDNPFLPAPIKAVAGPTIVDIERDNVDFSLSQNNATQDTIRGVFGVEGEIADWLSYDSSYVYGRTTANQTISDRYNDRYYAAIDVTVDPATGKEVCRSNLDPMAINPYGNYPSGLPLTFTPGPNSGCVPYNIFGYGVGSKAAKAWISATDRDRTALTQQVANISFTGKFDHIFKPRAGSIDFALGAEWRRETSDFSPDINQRNNTVFFGGAAAAGGAYSVGEEFAELHIPLLADLPFVHSLSIDSAGRASDYSTAGRNTTWNLGLEYSPVRDVTLRGTVSKSVRAPNIQELFQGNSLQPTFAGYNDPCDIANVNHGTQYRSANCATVLGALGVNPATFSPDSRIIIVPNNAVASGNPTLAPEVSRTWTAGIALEPTLVQGLRATLDWYDVKLTGAISEPTIDSLLALCVDTNTVNNPYCPLVTRNSVAGPTKGYFSTGRVVPVNVGQLSTSGIDLTVNYVLPYTRLGNWNLHLVGNHLRSLAFIDAPGAPPRETAGDKGAPTYSAVAAMTWQRAAWSVNYGVSWWNETNRFTREQLAGTHNIADRQYQKIKMRLLQDVNVARAVNDKFTVYGGINNIADEGPDPLEQSTPQTTTSYPYNYPTGPVGRFFYLGAKYQTR